MSLVWKDVCDDIVTALNGASYEGPLVITDQARRAYLPRFDDQSLSELQVVVAPAEVDFTFAGRKRSRQLDQLSVAVHVVSPSNTIELEEIDDVFQLANEIIDKLSAADSTFGGKHMISAGLSPVFDPDVFERHLAVWVVPVFAFK